MAGCYGKIPALGDFLSRNLPAGFVESWDGWLRRVMSACAQSGDDQWVDRYLSSPIWRFAASPGAVGAAGRAGILVPSVDSVGRCFPLTIVTELPDPMALADVATDWAEGYERAEMMAIGALGRALDPEAFAGRVADLTPPAASPAAADNKVERWTDPAAAHLGARVAGSPSESGGAEEIASVLAMSLVTGTTGGASLWWHLDWENRPATTALFVGLPPPAAVASMLLGTGGEPGWSR